MKRKITDVTKNLGKNKKILFIIIILAIFLNIFNSYVLAKYSSGFIINAVAQIAKPIVKIEGEETKQITVFSPEESYLFSVKNYNELEEINEASMIYYIEIISEKIEMLEIHLYKGEEEIVLTNYKTQDIELKIGEKQEDKYCLYVKVLEDIEENLLEDVKANIEIKIHSIQKEN